MVAQLKERNAIASGPNADGALHYCNSSDYIAALAKVERIAAWCGTEIQGRHVYPKDRELVKCEACRAKREELRAAMSEEVWRLIDADAVAAEPDEEDEDEENETER